MNWNNIKYLENGNKKQQDVYKVVVNSRILETLSEFTPTVVSTICVGLDIDKSDIDIICYTKSIVAFKDIIEKNYSKYTGFKSWYRNIQESEFVCSFFIKKFEFEIYASLIPVERQNAYRHLTIMKRLIDIGGENFCNRVRHLKMTGYKTEPAIANLLNLDGNPYNAVVNLEKKNDKDLKKLLKQIL